MELEVKTPKKLPDGIHQGNITEIVYTKITGKENQEIPYIRVKIESEGAIIEYGCSQTLTMNSKLGKLLAKFTSLDSGKKINLEQLLVGKSVVFQTTTNERGYSEIPAGSIKPLNPPVTVERNNL